MGIDLELYSFLMSCNKLFFFIASSHTLALSVPRISEKHIWNNDDAVHSAFPTASWMWCGPLQYGGCLSSLAPFPMKNKPKGLEVNWFQLHLFAKKKKIKNL